MPSRVFRATQREEKILSLNISGESAAVSFPHFNHGKIPKKHPVGTRPRATKSPWK